MQANPSVEIVSLLWACYNSQIHYLRRISTGPNTRTTIRMDLTRFNTRRWKYFYSFPSIRCIIPFLVKKCYRDHSKDGTNVAPTLHVSACEPMSITVFRLRLPPFHLASTTTILQAVSLKWTKWILPPPVQPISDSCCSLTPAM